MLAAALAMLALGFPECNNEPGPSAHLVNDIRPSDWTRPVDEDESSPASSS